jgi:hypothetical protein
MNKRGQAVIEYLVTYGWMLLVILITIGLILYFDILNPIKFVPQQCEFGEQLHCVDMQLLENGTFKIKFQNNFPKAVNLTDSASKDYPIICGGEVTILPNEIQTLSCNIDNAVFVQGEKRQVSLMIRFNRFSQGHTIAPPVHELRGVFVTTVE